MFIIISTIGVEIFINIKESARKGRRKSFLLIVQTLEYFLFSWFYTWSPEEPDEFTEVRDEDGFGRHWWQVWGGIKQPDNVK